MKIAKSNRKARITEQEVNTALYVSSDGDNNYYYYQPYKDLPILYEIAVQVRILGFWFTIWEASVEIADGDGRTTAMNRASEIVKLLEGII